MIVKNETKSILKTLNSIKDFADILCIMDTGSEDDTIQKIEKFCERTNIKLHLFESYFQDFQQARNTALLFAESWDECKGGYILILDANDELREGKYLREKIIEGSLNKVGYILQQEWKTYDEKHKYWNIKLIKANTGWFWKGKVHETLYNNTDGREPDIERLPTNIIIYQDRNENCEQTKKRIKRDIEILKEELVSESTDIHKSRILYYLGSSYHCMSNIYPENREEYLRLSLKYYKERIKFNIHKVELCASCESCGDIELLLDGDYCQAIVYYLKSLELIKRSEPLVKISIVYHNIKDYVMAYMFISMACRLAEPKNVLFENNKLYDYTRWYLLSVACLEIGRFDQEMFKAGIEALDVASKALNKTEEEQKEFQNLYLAYKEVAMKIGETLFKEVFEKEEGCEEITVKE